MARGDGPDPGVPLDRAQKILAAERDRKLGLDVGVWPRRGQTLEGWTNAKTCFRREIRRKKKDDEAPARLEESILRFPSAPLHGLQRWHGNHVPLAESENFHTYRVLRASPVDSETKRIFLMHTGLNERSKLVLYYRLASHLVSLQPGTVCIVRPFPGHMSRFPFPDFAETPLDRYLWDGSHLFRQFLRFMIETQWFLSALVRRSSYRCASGANLLAEHRDDRTETRLDSDCLATEMREAWMSLRKPSIAALRKLEEQRADLTPVKKTVPPHGAFVNAVDSLRDVLGLDAYPAQDGDLTETPRDHLDEPELHVFGYSLGGFTAQSVLMSWPFVIASCSNLLAGGALRELAPTAFADPEEWQTVLHSLRYELDDRLMSPDVRDGSGTVAGMDPDLFTYFKRTFYEVFQQEYRGGFESRAEAFRERMFFIVGGDDPVVRPQSVVGSVEKGGLNLLEIGGLSHFVGGRSRSRGERKVKRPVWVPEMARLIHEVADTAARSLREERPYVWFDRDIAYPEKDKSEFDRWLAGDGGSKERRPGVRPLEPAEVVSIGTDGALPGELFERCLDDLLVRLDRPEEPGVLFVLRNEVPPILLPDEAVRESAAALYHDDFGIARYCHGIRARAEVVRKRIGRVCLILPWNAKTLTMHLDQNRAYPSQAESAGGQVQERRSPDEMWEHALEACWKLTEENGGEGSVRVFDGRDELPDDRGRLFEAAETDWAHGERLEHIAALPDCWVWMTGEFLEVSLAKVPVIDRARRALTRKLMGASEDEMGATESEIQDAIANDTVRVLSLSRARYNPRFRGRLELDGKSARKRLFHVAMCAALADRIQDADPFE
jgi:hypothetical protein